MIQFNQWPSALLAARLGAAMGRQFLRNWYFLCVGKPLSEPWQDLRLQTASLISALIPNTDISTICTRSRPRRPISLKSEEWTRTSSIMSLAGRSRPVQTLRRFCQTTRMYYAASKHPWAISVTRPIALRAASSTSTATADQPTSSPMAHLVGPEWARPDL
jgi:hypothetical protein